MSVNEQKPSLCILDSLHEEILQELLDKTDINRKNNNFDICHSQHRQARFSRKFHKKFPKNQKVPVLQFENAAALSSPGKSEDFLKRTLILGVHLARVSQNFV